MINTWGSTQDTVGEQSRVLVVGGLLTRTLASARAAGVDGGEARTVTRGEVHVRLRRQGGRQAGVPGRERGQREVGGADHVVGAAATELEGAEQAVAGVCDSANGCEGTPYCCKGRPPSVDAD